MTDQHAIRPLHVKQVPLGQLLKGLGLGGDIDATTEVSNITLDSRTVVPGTLYAALPGSKVHGAQFAASAIEQGAVAILTDPQGRKILGDCEVPVLVSGDARADTAALSARIFGHPADQVSMIGVTGTNGKTTTVALLEAGLSACGVRVGTIGTVGFRLDGVAVPSGRGTITTPDSPDLQALLAVMVEQGAEAVAIEVSSHALATDRVAGIRFGVSAFLNLGRDHLDFHKDMEDYFEAKVKLFTKHQSEQVVCWLDDEHSDEIRRRAVLEGLPVATVGTGPDADWRLENYESVAPLGGSALLSRGEQQWELKIELPGFHNMIDAAIAVAMLVGLGHPIEQVLEGIGSAQVPGRMQLLPMPDAAPTVIVDFAHTPQAVEATLAALRGSFGKLVTVIGCGGDRDASKREGMGRAAASWSDHLIITDDNPRTEDPAAIRAAALRGARSPGSDATIEEVAGRRAAIERALRIADAASVVAILGKGHEQGQQIGDAIFPFDDTVEALAAWERIGGERG